jgi:hypothetical protein
MTPLRQRRVAVPLWCAAFAADWLMFGLPVTDPLQSYLWLWLLVFAWRPGRPWRTNLAFGRDWLPVVLLLEAYNYSRGFADNGVTPHFLEMIHADKFLLGHLTGGVVPTVWLQRHFYDPAHLHWWDAAASWIYFTHFIATPLLAAILWLQNRDVWLMFVRRWFALSALGIVTYFAFPAAPPWLAADDGLIEPVVRISTRGWQALGLHGTGNLLHTGQLAANPVAAMPSLHGAFALLVSVTLLGITRRRWWPLLVAYPLAMALTLLYSGEHYAIDILVGWAYVAVAVLLADGYGRWRTRHRAARSPMAAPTDSPSQRTAVQIPTSLRS